MAQGGAWHYIHGEGCAGGRAAHGIRVVISVAFKHQLPISPKMEALITGGTPRTRPSLICSKGENV